MAAVSVIFPVFFLLFLGGHARRRAWISHEQNEGAKRIALDILFPFLIYQVMVETNLEKGVFLEISLLSGRTTFQAFTGRLSRDCPLPVLNLRRRGSGTAFVYQRGGEELYGQFNSL